jgi:pSer/pThr/pTyr-binding forkhead associated (FHA) protein/ketosteroid isomerase-like protein
MASRSYQLVVQKGPNPGQVFDLTQAEISIGRELYNDFPIDDRALSRRHARLRLEAESYILEDLGSTNGTYVNGARLEGERILQPGDEISVGEKVLLVFNQVGAPASPSTVRLGASSTMRLDAIPAAPQPQAAKEAPALSTAEEHRQLFTRWFEELWNKKNYAITQELVHPEFTAHGAGGQDIKQGPNGVAGMVSTWHKAFPDGRMTMDDIITEGDLSVIRMTFTGTHKGDFYGVPPSNKVITVTSIGIDKVIDGKITEGWGELNMLGMMMQMGAIPAPQPPTHTIQAAVTPEHVQEAYGALASGDINRIRMYWADEMVWQVPGHNQLSGWYTGLDEFLAFMGNVGEMSDHSFNMQPIAGKVLVTGDYSVDLTRNRGYRRGQPQKTMDIEVAHVLRWRHGKVIAGKGAIFGDGTEEYDQFWSNSPAVTPSSQ